MLLKKEQIHRWFSQTDYQRGMHYYREGRVVTQEFEVEEDEISYSALVHGSSDDYDIYIRLRPNQLQGSCTCPWFAQTHSCKHLVAGLLTIADGAKTPPKKALSDRYARRLLDTYRSQKPQLAPSGEQAQLVPRLTASPYGDQYPYLSFQVGYQKLYIIKNIHEFLRAFQTGEVLSYGKGLQLRHDLDEFTPLSRQLIELLSDQFLDLKSFQNRFSTYSDPTQYYAKSSEIVLTGQAFDRFFDLYLNQTIVAPKQLTPHTLKVGNPKISLMLEQENNAAKLRIPQLEELSFFGNSRRLYAITENEVLRCSPEFQKQAYPMLEHSAPSMTMVLEDLPDFCSVVLPEIRNLIHIEDKNDLLPSYLPDDGIPCFYFDMEDERLICRLKFRYGQVEVTENGTTPVLIRRDPRMESHAHALLAAHMEYFPPQELFAIFDEEKIFLFLTGSMEFLQQIGEVYLSQRLQNKQVRPSKTAVGVSVSNGMLNLDIDTGEFPAEELEALYNSLLQRRKYYRLKDGRFLALTGSSSYETLAEMAHMTQLSPEELEQGHISLPLYRGLYLDSVLKQNKSLSVTRDSQFRSMVRSFKTVSDNDYDLPDTLNAQLRPYQETGYRWLKTLESYGFGGILADEMGLGKTLQVITFLMTASRQQTGMPSLIICPSSLVLNWADECRRFAPSLRVTLLIGTAAERKQLLFQYWESADLFVTSYDLLKRDISDYADRAFYCCVLDEGQYIKNQSTLVSKSVKRINARQRFVLTGTPIENRLSELWNLFDFLMPNYLFAHRRFVENLEKPIVKSGDENASRQLSKMVQPFLLRRLKQDVLKELPPKVEHTRRISMGEEQRKAYLAAAAAAKQELLLGDGGKMKVLALLTKLRQICCDPSLSFENYEGESAKLDACMELCRGMADNGHQILLFSQFTSMLDIIRQRLDDEGLTSFTLQGSTPKEKRAELVRRFNQGEAQVFLISLKAGGTGLNLTAADVVIHYDPWWNIAAQNQATDRAHRIGQQSCVQVYKLIAKDSIEEKILDLQEQKAALMDAISGNGESIMSMSQEDLLALLE